MVAISSFDRFALVFFAIIVGIIFVSGALNTSQPFHTLQQIAVSSNNLVSVGADGDGVIDLANASVQIKCPDGTYREMSECDFSGTGIGSSLPECEEGEVVIKDESFESGWGCLDLAFLLESFPDESDPESGFEGDVTNGGTAGTSNASTFYSFDRGSAKAFDDDLDTSWRSTSGAPQWISFKFSSPVFVGQYRIFPYDDGAYSPVSWTFEGSNDGVTWVVLDVRENYSLYNDIWFAFMVETPGDYSWYRLNITKATSTSRIVITEIEFINTKANNIPSASTNTYAAPKAFDSNPKTYWKSASIFSTGHQWLMHDSFTAKQIMQYGVYSTGYNMDWKFQGSNDAISWTTLDEQIDIDFPTIAAWYYFPVTSLESHRFHRLYFTRGGSGIAKVSELDLIESQQSAITASSFYLSYGVTAVFDGVEKTSWKSSYKMSKRPKWVQYDFGQGVSEKITSYKIKPYSTSYYYPIDWVFQGSNNGVNWTNLHTVTGNTFTNLDYAEFNASNTTEYRYYRLYITKSKNDYYVRIKDIEFVCDGVVCK